MTRSDRPPYGCVIPDSARTTSVAGAETAITAVANISSPLLVAPAAPIAPARTFEDRAIRFFDGVLVSSVASMVLFLYGLQWCWPINTEAKLSWLMTAVTAGAVGGVLIGAAAAACPTQRTSLCVLAATVPLWSLGVAFVCLRIIGFMGF